MALTPQLLRYTGSFSLLMDSPERAAERLGVLLLEQTPQVQGTYTLLRDKDCPKEDFIFYTDRISTLLVERAMQELPFSPHDTVTPVGEKVRGKILTVKVCHTKLD